MPNLTQTPRPMLAIVYTRRIVNRGNGMPIARDVWSSLPERSREILRFNRIIDGPPIPADQ